MGVEALECTTATAPTLSERQRMKLRPPGKAVMLQTWLDLVFLHFPVDPAEAQRLLPQGLTIDTYPDALGRPQAWIGLVAFHIEGIRPPWSPPLPYLSAFAEVNVRTYAHYEGREPAVWFCSLDGGALPVQAAARAWYKVPYTKARVRFSRTEADVLRYQSARPSGSGCLIEGAIDTADGCIATPGSLEEFLFERYMLYSESGGRLYSARVSHAPYRVSPMEVRGCKSDLCACAGVPERPWQCAHYCSRVEAEFFAPRRLKSPQRT